MDHLIRRAVDSDCVALTRLVRGSSAYHGRYAAMISNYVVTADQVRRDHVHLLEDEGQVLGFYSLTGTVADAELDLMFVSDEAQGRGIGAALFRHMKITAKTCGLRAVKIVSHPPAKNFYLKMGALEVGVREASGTVPWDRPILTIDLRSASA